MDKEILLALIASISAIIAALEYFLKPIKNLVRKFKNKRTKQLIINSEVNELEIFKIMMFQLTQTFNFNNTELCKYHDSGDPMHELSVKKITIIEDAPGGVTVKSKKSQWQGRLIDRDFRKQIIFLINDKITHIKDLEEQIEEGVGLRSMYNINKGHELLLIELGVIKHDYYFMVMQRDRVIKTDQKIFLSDTSKQKIQYWCEKVWELTENAKKSA